MAPTATNPPRTEAAGLGNKSCVTAERQSANQARNEPGIAISSGAFTGSARCRSDIAKIEAGAPVETTLEIYTELPARLIRPFGGSEFLTAVFPIDGRRS
jgi:hypothetical protein